MSGYVHPIEQVGHPAALPRGGDREDWERVPIMPSRARQAEAMLDANMAVALQPVVTEPPKNWVPEEFAPEVNAWIDQIHSNITQIEHYDTAKWLIELKTDPKISDIERYVRHQAIVSFLAKVGLLSVYFKGREIWPVSLRYKAAHGTITDDCHRESWAVSIGYIPQRSRFNLTFLTTEFRYGEDMVGYRYSLVGYKHAHRKTPEELAASGLL